MYTTRIPYIIKLLFLRKTNCSINTSEKVLYYTFDDGPVPEVTAEVLSILEKYNAKATFFCVGENIQKHPEIFDEIIKKGHIVGNHTYNHLKAFYTPNSEYYENIEKATKYIPGKLFRPPHGQISPRQIKFLSKTYKIVLWSVLSGDFDKNKSPEDCFKNIVKYSKNGSIIVMHDSIKAKSRILYSLEKSLEYFSKKGYKFKNLECLING